jgi:hypothetical protein
MSFSKDKIYNLLGASKLEEQPLLLADWLSKRKTEELQLQVQVIMLKVLHIVVVCLS